MCYRDEREVSVSSSRIEMTRQYPILFHHWQDQLIMRNIDIVVFFFAGGRTDRQPANPNRGVRPLFRFEHVSLM